MSRLFEKLTRRKVVERDVMKTELKRCLRTIDLIFIGIGAMVGSGMYVLTGQVAHSITGPAIIVSLVIAGITSGLSAWCYAEFGSRVPKAGSAYVYTYIVIGELAAFVIGWTLILEQVAGSAAVIRALLGYVNDVTQNTLSNLLPNSLTDAGRDPYTTVFIAFACFIVASGIRESIAVNNVLTCLNLSVALFVGLCGIYIGKWENWTQPHGFMPFGISSVLEGAAVVYYSFVGYDAIAITSEEALTPGFSIPFALAFDVTFVGALYCLVAAALNFMVPYTDISEEAAFGEAFDFNDWHWAKYVVNIGAISALMCTSITSIVIMPRCLYALSSDGLLFKKFSEVDQKTKVPVFATIVGCCFVALMAFFLTLKELAEFLSIGTLMAYLVIAFAVIVLRYSPTDLLESPSKEVFDCSVNVIGSNSSANQTSLQPIQVKLLSSFLGLVVLINVLIRITQSNKILQEYQNVLIIFVIILVILLVFVLVALSKVSTENRNPTACQIPFVPYLPALSVFINFHLMTHLSVTTWLRFVVWLILGLIVYFCYGIKNSKVATSNREKKTNF